MDINKLEKLKELKDKGILSQEEFDKQIVDYVNSSDKSSEKSKESSINLNPNLGFIIIKPFLFLAIIVIGIYIAVETIFPKQIPCKEGISEKRCECVRLAVAHNVSFLDKIKMLATGASAAELSSYINFGDALRCTFAKDDEEHSETTIKSNNNILEQALPTSFEYQYYENESDNKENNFVYDKDNIAFDKESDAYKTVFWYGDTEKDKILKEKYFKGQLTRKEVWNYCSDITSCTANASNCVGVYESHHEFAFDHYDVPKIDKISQEQLEGISTILCGKKVCTNKQEILKHLGVQDDSEIGQDHIYCDRYDGCNVGDYYIADGVSGINVINKILEKRR